MVLSLDQGAPTVAQLEPAAVYATDKPAACASPGTLTHPQPRVCLPEIDTDRPHRTDTPATVPAGHVQSELGMVMYEARAADAPTTIHFLDVLLKLGLTARMDLQVGYSPLAMRQRGDRAGWLGGTHVVTGQSLYLRSKIRLHGDSASPLAVTVAPVVSLPLGSSSGLEGGGMLLFGAEITSWLSWEVNGSVFWEQQERTDSHAIHFVPCTALTARLFGPIKAFGEIYYERPMTGTAAAWSGTVDGGVLWLVTNDVQLDMGLYVGTTADVRPYTAFVGLSFRL
jgi:hypothetical protein